ncbi:retrotransposon protein, putative, ty1-copia subclass, partial [Tanacetum coccineum]
KVFKNEVENQLEKTIKAIRSDRGGEYISKEFKDYLKANGIVQQLTPPYTPQHNGVSERRNRTLSKRLIGIGQNAYMDKILRRYKMDNSKHGHIPKQERLNLNKSQGAQTSKEVNRMKNVPYASVVGSIMYAVRCTIPDVAFAQNMTSRFQQNPGELHWTAVKNILKYLRNTKDMFLVYGENSEAELRVDCYCNAGFEIDINDMKSLTGYVSF